MTVQAVCSQDSCLAEAFKVRNLLSEFDTKAGAQEVALVGFREYIFSQNTGALSLCKGGDLHLKWQHPVAQKMPADVQLEQD